MRNTFILLLLILTACSAQEKTSTTPLPGIYDTEAYFPLLQDKHVALAVNHTSVINGTHLTDTLTRAGFNIRKVFTPEHGFKGSASDGEEIEYSNDSSVYELISLYGQNKKPTPQQLEGLDVMVFDMQDVGTRFYTYLSTMHYVMEACAENNVQMVILDRPNPNGSYVDGPVLDTAFRSFVGMHPIPIVHGMTLGELAHMINGEGWLQKSNQVDLTVISIRNWTHSQPYSPPLKPSPNLPNDLSISLYPSLCLFEGTIMSVGRGTDHPFQQIGHPLYPDTLHSFVPTSMEGAKWPPYEEERCYGISWTGQSPTYGFSLKPLIEAYHKMDTTGFFNSYFKRLAGTDLLQKQIEDGWTEAEIRETWRRDLDTFKALRKKYLLYD